MNDTNTTQVFAEHGRKGISYDWRSLMVAATDERANAYVNDSLASLRELDLELAASF